MKKMFALLLAVVMLLSLTGCGKKEAQETQNQEIQSTSQTEKKPDGQDDHSWEDVDADTIYSYLGFRFTEPAGATNIIYRWDAANSIGQMQFQLSGTEWTARAKKTTSIEDISGMSYSWDTLHHAYITNYNFELCGDYHFAADGKEVAHAGLWFYEGADSDYHFTFSLTCKTKEEVDIAVVASQIFVLKGAGADDATRYGQSYWEEKYPGYSICPFYINVNGEDQYYYWATDGEGYTGNIRDWVDSDFNWNGWHIIGRYIVNADETFQITTESMQESFSSFCTYYTEKFDPEDPTIYTRLFNYDDRYSYFMELVEKYDGFEAVYRNNEQTTFYCGGKDDVYWFIEMPEEGDSYYYIGQFDGKKWTCSYCWENEEEHGDIEEVWEYEAIDRICYKVYYDQDCFDPAEVSPMDVEIAGRPAKRYNRDFGIYSTEIDVEYLITIGYCNTEDEYSIFSLEDIYIGSNVEVAEFPTD
ncbi:MAG: hypothetical protein E7256_03025 [Lachnospiraceae bacterium]|nr:hypothetical protein [Lachnospiraceae bacterium]